MAADTTSLSPSDARVAIASFPRRFRAALAGLDDDVAGPDELARRMGPDGTSAADALVVADGLVTGLARLVDDVHAGRDPVVHPALVDAPERAWRDEHSSLAVLLEQFDATCGDAVAGMERLSADEWGVRVGIAGRDQRPDALDVCRAVVAGAADALREAAATMEAVRR